MIASKLTGGSSVDAVKKVFRKTMNKPQWRIYRLCYYGNDTSMLDFLLARQPRTS
jgi:hypothetical protein